MMSSSFSDPAGHTALTNAVLEQDIDLITALIDTGADLETRDKQGQNILYHAFPEFLTSNAFEVLKLLISRGININSNLDGDGCSAMVTAVVQDWPDVICLLLDSGVDVNEDAMSKFTGSLSSDPACQMNMIEQSTATTQFIFSKGCGHSVTPLSCAVMYQRRHIFDKLMTAHASEKSPSNGTFWRASGNSVCSNCDIQISALQMAAYTGDVGMAYSLLQHKTDIPELNINENHAHSFNEISPLWFAMLQGHESTVKLFLSLGQPIVFPCHFGSGLQICLEEGHTSIALMVLRAGYDLSYDLDWIEEQRYPTSDEEVIERIENMVNQPRPLLDWCCDSLRTRFGLTLNEYLRAAGSPNRLVDILNFNDLSKASWQSEIV